MAAQGLAVIIFRFTDSPNMMLSTVNTLLAYTGL